MPITIPDRIAPQSSLGSTHEDIYGTGGYVAIATGLSGSPNSTQISQAINAAIPVARRKVGMLVFDSSLSRNYRCSATDPGTWIHVFANDGTIDLTGYVQRSELPSSGSPPVLDIASDTELAEFGLTALRVYPNGTSNLTVGTENDALGTSILRVVATAANVGSSSPATLQIMLNTAAIGGVPNDAN